MLKLIFYWVLLVLLFSSLRLSSGVENEEITADFWTKIGVEELNKAISDTETLNKNVAKNVIVFLGDGMSVSTVTAARILKGQLNGQRGEESKLAMDRFPHAALSRTYSVDRQVADSASTATAYLGGVKTNYYTLGVTAAVTRGNCLSSKGKDKEVTSVLVDAWKKKKSAGIVTTTRIQHATPGAVYAHTPDRKWYSDAQLTDEARKNGCKDIAQQFLDSSHMFKVVLGGGRQFMLPNITTDVEYQEVNNLRLDGQDLIQQWIEKQKASNEEASYVTNKQEFDQVDPDSTDYLLGLFEPKDMQFEVDRASKLSPDEPSIAEMTEKAISILQKNPNGFFLLVEGGRIDHAHHMGNAYLSLHDTVAFDKAIEKGIEMTSDRDTLIIVTADHGHTMTMGGYSYRGNDIFGFAPSDKDMRLAEDGKPFTTLLYANGPGYKYNISNGECPHDREDLTDVNIRARDYLQQAAVPLSSETHGGEDVEIFARGPMSHLFHGVHQQNYIATVIRYASCVGGNNEHCEKMKTNPQNQQSTFAILFFVTLGLLIFSIIIIILLLFNQRKRKSLKNNEDTLQETKAMMQNV